MHRVNDPRASLIKQIKRFTEIDDNLVKEITDQFELEEYDKKEMLLKAGDIPECEFYVVKGSLRVFYVDQNGTEHTLNLCLEDWWAGDLGALVNKTPAHYNIQALEPTLILKFKREQWLEFPNKYPEMCKYLRLAFQSAIIALHDRVRKNISTTAEDRYKELMEKYPAFFQRIPQKYIASYLGVTPEFLSMLRRKTLS